MSTETVIWEAADGWPGFHCSHAHCEGRTLWRYLGLGAVAWQVHRSALSDPERVADEIRRQRGIQVEDLEPMETKP